MRIAGLFCLGALGLVWPSVLLAQEGAQPDPADQGNTIVVAGEIERASRAEVHGQALDIAVSGNIFETPLARFEDPLCPGVAGLTAETASLMVDRIRQNAQFVQLAVQDDGCTPNFIVAFVDDGQTTLTGLMEENPARFQYLSSVEKREMLAPGPVHVWTDVQTASRDGMAIGRGRNLVNAPQVGGWMAHSRIYTAIRNDILTVMILVDRAAVRDLTLLQLADYATMRGLVRTRPPREASVPSILSLFQPGSEQANGLTDFDRAYLTSVYAWIPNLPAAAHLGRVAAEMREIEDGEGGE